MPNLFQDTTKRETRIFENSCTTFEICDISNCMDVKRFPNISLVYRRTAELAFETRNMHMRGFVSAGALQA